MSTETDLLTVKQLARRWNKSVWWIYENRVPLGIPCIRLGKQLRFKLNAIEEWECGHAA